MTCFGDGGFAAHFFHFSVFVYIVLGAKNNFISGILVGHFLRCANVEASCFVGALGVHMRQVDPVEENGSRAIGVFNIFGIGLLEDTVHDKTSAASPIPSSGDTILLSGVAS